MLQNELNVFFFMCHELCVFYHLMLDRLTAMSLSHIFLENTKSRSSENKTKQKKKRSPKIYRLEYIKYDDKNSSMIFDAEASMKRNNFDDKVFFPTLRSIEISLYLYYFQA